MLKLIKSKIQYKLISLITLIIVLLISVFTITSIINRQNELLSFMIDKQYVFGRFVTRNITDSFFRTMSYTYNPEEWRQVAGLEKIEKDPVPDSYFHTNKDVVRYLIINTNGAITFDSDEFKPDIGYYPDDKPVRRVPDEIYGIVNNLEPNKPNIRFVKLEGKTRLEIIAPNTNPSGEHLHAVAYYVSLEDIENKIFTSTLLTLLLGVVIMIVAYIISTIVSKSIVKPILELEKSSKELSKGNYNVNTEIMTNDEVGKLAETFNSMTKRIKEYSEHLEEMVEKRTEELNTANEELLSKNNIMLKELEMAKRVQENILPTDKDISISEEVRFVTSYSALESIGGDLYDVLRVGKSTYGFFIADVSGHGVPAALITTMAKVSFTANSNWNVDTAQTCRKMNEELLKLIGDLEHYLTAYYCKLNLENGELQYTNCGHHPAIVIRNDTGEIEELDTKGFFIGSFEQDSYETKTAILNEGDKVLMFTDGIIEARSESGDFYGYEKLTEHIDKYYKETLNVFIDELIKDVNEFCGKRPADDDRAVLYFEFVNKVDSDIGKNIEESVIIESKTQPADQKEDPENILLIRNKYLKALKEMRDKNYTEALKIFREVNELDPENIKVLNNIGIILYKLGYYEDAYKTLQSIVRRGMASDTVKKNISIVKKKLDG